MIDAAMEGSGTQQHYDSMAGVTHNVVTPLSSILGLERALWAVHSQEGEGGGE